MTRPRRRPANVSREETLGTAFAPGHITGVFAPRVRARDPRARGSVGAGLVVELGARATARWRAGPNAPVVVRSPELGPLRISQEVAERLKGERSGRLVVDLRHELPVGQGFGMSAAGALATGHAVALAIGAPSGGVASVAHLADLTGGGGLGGVAAILAGGLEVRRSPGIPPFGRVVRRPFPRPVFLGVAGPPLPSPPLLRDPRFLERVDLAAREELARVGRAPDPDRFLAAAERFTDRLALAPSSLQRRIVRLRTTGARVAQTMFGRAFFAVPSDDREHRRLVAALRREGLRAVEVSVVPPSTETL